jgi:hypothetical protein
VHQATNSPIAAEALRRIAELCSFLDDGRIELDTNTVERVTSGHPMSRLDDLLPWNWAPANAKT